MTLVKSTILSLIQHSLQVTKDPAVTSDWISQLEITTLDNLKAEFQMLQKLCSSFYKTMLPNRAARQTIIGQIINFFNSDVTLQHEFIIDSKHYTLLPGFSQSAIKLTAKLGLLEASCHEALTRSSRLNQELQTPVTVTVKQNQIQSKQHHPSWSQAVKTRIPPTKTSKGNKPRTTRTGTWSPSSDSTKSYKPLQKLRIHLRTSPGTTDTDITQWAHHWDARQVKIVKTSSTETSTNFFCSFITSDVNAFEDHVPLGVTWSRYRNQSDPIDMDTRWFTRRVFCGSAEPGKYDGYGGFLTGAAHCVREDTRGRNVKVHEVILTKTKRGQSVIFALIGRKGSKPPLPESSGRLVRYSDWKGKTPDEFFLTDSAKSGNRLEKVELDLD